MGVLDPAATPPVVGDDGWKYTARVVKWTDGDTAVIDCVVDVGFEEMMTKRRRIRLLGVNTPELNSPDPAKRDAARAARAFCEGIAPAGSVVWVTVVKYDKYGGRDDGHVYPENGVSIAARLIAAGFGLPYDGGAR